MLGPTSSRRLTVTRWALSLISNTRATTVSLVPARDLSTWTTTFMVALLGCAELAADAVAQGWWSRRYSDRESRPTAAAATGIRRGHRLRRQRDVVRVVDPADGRGALVLHVRARVEIG